MTRRWPKASAQSLSNGKMIDVPVVERAGLLLEREAAIAAREAKKGQYRRLIRGARWANLACSVAPGSARHLRR